MDFDEFVEMPPGLHIMISSGVLYQHWLFLDIGHFFGGTVWQHTTYPNIEPDFGVLVCSKREE